MRKLHLAGVLILLSTAVSFSAGFRHATAADEVVMIDNGIVCVRFDPQAATFSARRGDRQFIVRGTFGDFLPAGEIKVRKTQRNDSLGPGSAIEVAHPSGRTAALVLYDRLPFVCIKTSIHNPTSKPAIVTQFTPLSARVELGAAAEDLRSLGYDGLAPADRPKTTYVCISVANPGTGAGVVCGWLTHDRASGIVASRPEGDGIQIEGRAEYGRLLVPAGKTAEGETLAVGYFDDALDGLEQLAETIAKVYRIKLKKVPSGYMTWYHAGALDEKRMPVLAQWCAENLRQFGLDFLQIDHGWQLSRRDFTSYNPKGGYPHGMKPTAQVITSHGFDAGIWITPFGWDHKRPVFAGHQDWFVKRNDGSVYAVYWAGDCLDMSHPEARKFLHGQIDRMANDWGYKFFKLDGLWAGVAAKMLYAKPQYRPDNLGDAVFHDPGVTNIEAFRKGLQVVRRAAGPDVYLLGCTAAQNMRTLGGSFGLVDGMRVGVDSGRKWAGIVANVKVATSIYYLHGRVWHNDPDVLYLDKSFTLDQVRAWASWLALTGQMYMVSEWLPDVPAERLDVVKRTIPNHNRLARPIDLFESFPARVWHLQDGKGERRRDIVGLFNWGTNVERLGVDLAKLSPSGSPDDHYVGFDFWENKFVPPVAGSLDVDMRPGSCRMIALKRVQNRPQLVSTSRHVTQGVIDVAVESWDAAIGTLSGRSRVVGGDPYELRIATPEGGKWRATAASASHGRQQTKVAVTIKQDGPWVRVAVNSPATGEISWRVVFRSDGS